ncbi:hypothetical protein COP2_009040 [Malus domestica]
MEESIRSLCKGVASFCNHFHSSCDALKTSVDRRPIPLDTASSNFLNPSTAASPPPAPNSTSLKRCRSAPSPSRSSWDTAARSKDNQTCLLHLQRRLSPSSVAQLEIDEDDFERTPVVQEEGFYAPVIDEEEDLLDESLSLKKLGLSDASLATLASQGQKFISKPGSYDASTKTSGAPRDGLLSDFGEVEDKPKL